LLNILNILFEIEQDNLITKKILKAFTTLLKEGDIIIIFNSDYLTLYIIEILNSKCVQTLIIFNTPGNIKDTISNNIENLILQTKDFFKMSDNKTIDDEWQNTGSIEIIKI
jgi:hypothetical protein